MFGLGKGRKRRGKRKGWLSAPAKHDGAASADTVRGPSPDPATNLILADLVLRSSGALVRNGVERALLGRGYAPDKADRVLSGRSLRQTLVGAALARVATRSVPGAIVVGGGMLAKTLYDRHRDSRDARARGEGKLARQAKRAD